MSEEANKTIVRRYFREAIDTGNSSVMAELFAAGAKQHFPGREVTFDPSKASARGNLTMHTDLHHLLSDGDYVFARLTHHVTFHGPAHFPTRTGQADASDRSIYWDAMAIFCLQDGKIVEAWVNRDELNILMQLDAVTIKSAV